MYNANICFIFLYNHYPHICTHTHTPSFHIHYLIVYVCKCVHLHRKTLSLSSAYAFIKRIEFMVYEMAFTRSVLDFHCTPENWIFAPFQCAPDQKLIFTISTVKWKTMGKNQFMQPMHTHIHIGGKGWASERGTLFGLCAKLVLLYRCSNEKIIANRIGWYFEHAWKFMNVNVFKLSEAQATENTAYSYFNSHWLALLHSNYSMESIFFPSSLFNTP